MEWVSPFVIYRIDEHGNFEEVYHSSDLRMAKYWLAYIGEPGDVLCRTPAHPKHDAEQPRYFSHKEKSGRTCSEEEKWKKLTSAKFESLKFPKEQLRTPESTEQSF